MYSRQFGNSGGEYASSSQIPPHYHGSAFDPPPAHVSQDGRHGDAPSSAVEQKRREREERNGPGTRGMSESDEWDLSSEQDRPGRSEQNAPRSRGHSNMSDDLHAEPHEMPKDMRREHLEQEHERYNEDVSKITRREERNDTSAHDGTSGCDGASGGDGRQGQKSDCPPLSHSGLFGNDWLLPLLLVFALNNQGDGGLKRLFSASDNEHTLLLLILAYVFLF